MNKEMYIHMYIWICMYIHISNEIVSDSVADKHVNTRA